MSLAINYCKELAHELRLMPVYPPGVSISPGDVIKFEESDFFGKPVGPFKKVTGLTDFGIDLKTEADKDPYSYVFASKQGVNVSFTGDSNTGSFGKGSLLVRFTKEGCTYLSALDCRQTRFSDYSILSSALEPHCNKIDWSAHYIVVGVTVASKALIMQSNSNAASLEMKGDVKNLQPVLGASFLSKEDISANISLQVSSYKDASFIKPWSDNVAVFFQLVRYRKSFLKGYELKSGEPNNLPPGSEHYDIEFMDPASL